MGNASPDMEETGNRPGKFKSAALRGVDAAMRGLQRLRGRLDPSGGEEEGAWEDAKRSKPGDDAGQEAAVPRRKSFLKRALIVLLYVLVGGAVGALLANRWLSKQIKDQEDKMEILRDALSLSKKNAAQLAEEKSGYQEEIGSCREKVAKIAQELDGCGDRTTAATSQPRVVGNAGPGPGRDAHHAVAPSRARQATPQKAGTCVAGGSNAAESLANCLKGLNR